MPISIYTSTIVMKQQHLYCNNCYYFFSYSMPRSQLPGIAHFYLLNQLASCSYKYMETVKPYKIVEIIIQKQKLSCQVTGK